MSQDVAPEDLAEILDHLGDSVALYELDSTVRYVNPRTELLFGKRLDELRGKRLFDVFPEAVGNPFHQAFLRVARTGVSENLDHYYAPLDMWFANEIIRVRDHVIVYANDITERIRRQRQLETVARISEVLISDELDRSTTAHAVATILCDVLDAQVSLAQLSVDREWLEVVALASTEPATHEIIQEVQRWRADLGHPGEALRTRSAILATPDEIHHHQLAERDARLHEVVKRYAPASVLVVPLSEGDEPFGVIIASRRQGARPLTLDDRALAVAIAPSVALYLALAHQRAQAANARKRLSVVADAIPALVSFVDREHRYQYANATHEKWFGMTPSSLLGKQLRDVMGPQAYASVEPHIEAALGGSPVRFRSTVTDPSGVREVDASYVPIVGSDGEVEGITALLQDVTGEARIAALEAEQREATRRLNERLNSLLALTAKLAGASLRDDIARVLVDDGVEALGCANGGMWLLAPGGKRLELFRERGFTPAYTAAFASVAVDAPGPLADCIRERATVLVTSRAEYAARYPGLESAHRPDPAPPLSFVVLPLLYEGKVIGCISFAFHEERPLATDERAYLEVLALHGAEALRRAHIYSELRDVSQTNAAMIQASPAAIMVLDEDGCVHAWNSAAERMFGWKAHEVLGRPLPAVGARIGDFKANLRHVLAGNETHAREAKRMRANGEWFDVELYAAPAKLSGRTLCLSMVLDISLRKRVERGRQLVAKASGAFARSLDLQQTLGEIVRLPIGNDFADWCCVDLLAPDGTLERIALTAEHVQPSTVMPRRLPHGAYAGSSRAIVTGKPDLLRDVDEAALARIARDDAHLAALRSLAMKSSLSVPLIIGDKILGALSLVARERNFDDFDVEIATEIASYAAIAIEHARLFDEARAARRAAEEANRSKDEFLAMLGHELRNPLAPLLTAVELMRMREPNVLEREREVIERQLQHVTRLVDDLLDVSRITRGKIELQREHVALASVVAKAIEQTSPLLEQRMHHVEVAATAPDVVVFGDPLRLAQVASNLIANAAKYTPPRGRISIDVCAESGHAVLRVRDNGQGIAPEMLPRIFDLFVQAPQPSERKDGGLGLGLTIVRSLVQQHDGTVIARSEGVGKGAEIEVRIPLAAATSTATTPSRPARTEAATSGRRVLIVDDNLDAVELLAELLAAYGHETRTANDGPTALRLVDEFLPEIALLDIGLPVMDGYELATRLRTLPQLRPLRLIAVTGYGQETDRQRARDAGFDAHLAKPVAIERLLELLDPDRR